MNQKQKNAEKIAVGLLEIEAIKLQPDNPFTWTSGRKAPIYCNNREALSDPKLRNKIVVEFCDLIEKRYPDVEVIAGVANAAISWGALVADTFGLPFVYVRSEKKEHGMGSLIEGKIMPGKKTVVIEDLISTGGSSFKAVENLKLEGFAVIGLAAIFTYELETAEKIFKEADLPVDTLCDYTTLSEIAITQGYVSEDEKEALADWRNNPSEWSVKRGGAS